MDTLGVMNIHDLAINDTIRQQAYIQARQEKINQRVEKQDANQTKIMGNKTPLESYPGALTISVEQQEDPQSAKIRVERQVDVQAAKGTVQGSEDKGQPKGKSKETGNRINIIA